MPLHRRKYYENRRRLMKQPYEAQEKVQRRFDYIIYAVIAAAVLFAMSYSLFKDHNIGRAVFFFLFFFWWTYMCFKPELHQRAQKKGWASIAKMTYDPKAEKLREEAALREERLKNPIDTETLILVDNQTDFEELEITLFDYVEVECETLCDNLPLLWKVGECRYAITFPCGVSRQHLYGLTDDLVRFLDTGTAHAWCRPGLFKEKNGAWLYLCGGPQDFLVAYTEDGTLWDIDYFDVILMDSHPASGYKEYPTIDWEAAERIGLYC